MGVYDINPDEYNTKLAEALKKIAEFEVPAWAIFVKTGTGKARPPADKDFWFNRAASILRQVYIRKIIGVNKLKTRYGNNKKRGSSPPEFRKGAGKIIRVILQQAEKAGLLEKVKMPKAGRKLTVKGKKLLDEIK
jgi:small subunit ribosomal protein S19e